MYEDFYGFHGEPFRLSPDARLCFPHASYKKARAYMQYALRRGEGFVMVTGRPGTGKTTLVNDITAECEADGGLLAALTSTQIQADDLLRLVVLKFGQPADTAHKSVLLHQLENFLQRLHREGRRPLLIIDEAQALPKDALEELRLMTNLQQDGQPLIQIFLIGQQELRGIVQRPELEQLHQRIVAACHLVPLDVEGTRRYIEHRLTYFGWQGNPSLGDSVYRTIQHRSLGIPRVINQICSRLLLHGAVEDKHALDETDIAEVIADLDAEQLLPQPEPMQTA